MKNYREVSEIPEHYLDMILANMPPPRYDPLQRPPAVLIARQHDLFKRLLQVIWSDALHEGMKLGMSIAQETRWMIVTPEERDRLIASLPPKEEPHA